MISNPVTAIAHPNIALIKYWGDVDITLHIPANGSISMNLDELFTRTCVAFDSGLKKDEFILDGKEMGGLSLDRVTIHLDHIRNLAKTETFARVESWNNFPMSAGIASSASGFAALSLAASRAAGLQLDETGLSRLARRGSGSACRSVPGGFVEWQAGKSDQESYALSIAPAKHWDIVDCIVVVSEEEKQTSSREGHSIAHTSVLQPARIEDTPRRLESCRSALMEQDFEMLAKVVEQDSNLMHSVMMTSNPPLIYWLPETLAVILAVKALRMNGIQACYTIDAGPNVHVLCPEEDAKEVYQRMIEVRGVKKVLICHPGGPAVIE